MYFFLPGKGPLFEVAEVPKSARDCGERVGVAEQRPVGKAVKCQ